MKRAGAVIAIALAAGAASSPVPAQPPVKSTSLYCELQLQTKGQTMVQHPPPGEPEGRATSHPRLGRDWFKVRGYVQRS